MFYDVIGFGETMLRLTPPLGGRLEEAHSLTPYVAGTESNTLCGMARLGANCAWVSVLPDNPLGRKVAGELRRHGVGTSLVTWAGEDARLGTFYVEEAPDPAGTRVYYDRAGSAFSQLDPDLLDLRTLNDARILHLTGVTPALGSGPRTAFSRYLRKAVDSGVEVSFDANYRAKLWEPEEAAAGMEEACQAAAVLICSREDASTLWGMEGDPERVLRAMERRFGRDKTLVLTLGGEGAAQLHCKEYDFAPCFPSKGEVRFGSGDAFAAGYLHAHLGGEHYEKTRENLGATPLLFGNAMAALKRCLAGDMPAVEPGEVLEVLRGHKGRFR